jgi:flagellar motor switch protein FliM
VLVANIEIAAEGQTSLVLICLPFSVLDKFFSSAEQQRVKQMTGTERERQRTREVLEVSLRATKVDVAARLPQFRVPMRQLLGLPVGSVLTTGIPTDAPLEIHVGGERRYEASSGRVGRRLAVRLADQTNAAPAARALT